MSTNPLKRPIQPKAERKAKFAELARMKEQFVRELKGYTFKIFQAFIDLMNHGARPGWFNISAAAIAHKVGCSERTAFRAIAYLRELGLLATCRRHRPGPRGRRVYAANGYRLTFPDMALTLGQRVKRIIKPLFNSYDRGVITSPREDKIKDKLHVVGADKHEPKLAGESGEDYRVRLKQLFGPDWWRYYAT